MVMLVAVCVMLVAAICAVFAMLQILYVTNTSPAFKDLAEEANNVELGRENGLQPMLLNMCDESIERDDEARQFGRPRVFLHVKMVNNWEAVARLLLVSMQESNMLEFMDVHVVVLGSEENKFLMETILIPFKNTSLRHHSTKMDEGHGPALRLMHRDATQAEENIPMLFVHTNGVDQGAENKFVGDWTALMTYFMINQHKMCLMMLHRVDVCGVNFRKSPDWHFYGNFWWANSRYIKTLGYRVDMADTDMWICERRPVAVSLWQSPLSQTGEHDTKEYHRREYDGHELLPLCTSKVSLPFKIH